MEQNTEGNRDPELAELFARAARVIDETSRLAEDQRFILEWMRMQPSPGVRRPCLLLAETDIADRALPKQLPDHHLPDAEFLLGARRRSPKPTGPRGFAPSSQPGKHLTDQQRRKLLALLKANPHRPSIVAKEFAEATGVTVSTVTVFITRKKAIKAGILQLAK